MFFLEAIHNLNNVYFLQVLNYSSLETGTLLLFIYNTQWLKLFTDGIIIWKWGREGVRQVEEADVPDF